METKEIKLKNGTTINVKSSVGMVDFGVIVRAVTEYCFDEDTGAYRPEFVDALTDMHIVAFYTDYPLPDEITDQYDAVVGDGIIDEIEPLLNKRQLDELRTAIIRAIDQRNAENTSVAALQMIKTAQELERVAGSIKDIDKDEMKKMLDYIGNGGVPDETKIVAALNETKKRGRKKKVE